MYDETFGKSEIGQLKQLDGQIRTAIKRGAPIAQLMQDRDALIAKAAARKGASIALSQYGAGGLAGSGIRGMDVVEHEFTPAVMRDYNIDGAGQGQRFIAQAPPGSGRLVPVNFRTSATSDSPIITLTAAAGSVVSGATNLVTRTVSWASLRIVGLTCQSSGTANAYGVMEDFKIGGSPNLFLEETYQLMDDYDVNNDRYTGLRAYPTLESPNTAEITAAIWALAQNDDIYAALSVVCEVLRDDAFGPGLPAPYAR